MLGAPGALVGAGLATLIAVPEAVKWSLPFGRKKERVLADSDREVQSLLSCVNLLIGLIQQRAGHVLLVLDGLDRIEDFERAKEIFLDSSVIGQLDCRVVLCGPFVLRRDGALLNVRGFSDVPPLVNSPVLAQDDPSKPGPGIPFFHDAFARRTTDLGAPPLVPRDQLDRLAYYSGGRAREFITAIRKLAEHAWDADVEAATGAQVDEVLDERRRRREMGLNRGHIEILEAVAADPEHRLPRDDLARRLRMVLPAPAAHDPVPSREGGFVEGIRRSLALSGARGILLHVDRAVPERLGELVRGLVGEYSEIDVHADLRAVETTPEGSVMVLILRPEDAVPLNLGRPIFERRRLKVALWCDRETTMALVERAPDFFDWVSGHDECPPAGPVAHAVAGLRAAYEAEAPGVVWRGTGDQDDKRRLLAAFAAAFPGEALTWIDPKRDYDELLGAVGRAAGAWIACRAQAESHVRRLRWAMAEDGRRGHAVIVTDSHPCPEWWPVHGRLMAFPDARRALEGAGASRPGTMAALAGLEPEAVEEIVRRMSLFHGSTDEIAQALPFAFSPGIVQARLIPEIKPSARRGRRIDKMGAIEWVHRSDDTIDELRTVERALRKHVRRENLAPVARAGGERDIAARWYGTRRRSRWMVGDGLVLSAEETRERIETLEQRTHRAIQLVDEGSFAEAIRVLEEQRDEIGALDGELPATRSAVRTVALALVKQGCHEAALPRVAGALALEGRMLGVD